MSGATAQWARGGRGQRGGTGLVGVRLDGEVDRDEIADLCVDAYRVVAPKRLVARLDAGSGSDGDKVRRPVSR
jgi:hypothetical protein